MLGLPKQTEVKKQLSKSAIYTKFQMNNAQKERIDADISKMVIVNEILSSTINIDAGNNVQAFFVVNVVLKRKDYDEKSIYTWDYIMEQSSKFNWAQSHFGDSNPYEELPELKIYTYDLGKILDKNQHCLHYITYWIILQAKYSLSDKCTCKTLCRIANKG